MKSGDMGMGQSREGGGLALAVPVLVLALAFVIFTVAQMNSLIHDRALLQSGVAAQEAPLLAAQRMRAQMEAIASDTAQLASAGNANAKRVIDEFRRRGINLVPGGGGGSPGSER